MNKTVVIIFVAVVTLAVGFIVYLSFTSDNVANNGDATLSGNTAMQAKVVKDACKVLTDEIARETLGTEITSHAENPVTTEDQQNFMSICHYNSKSQLSSGMELLVRSAKSEAGLESNRNQFNSTRPVTALPVNDIGDRAYYVTELKQLHILKDTGWYIISIYSESDENAGSLEKEKALATKMNLG